VLLCKKLVRVFPPPPTPISVFRDSVVFLPPLPQGRSPGSERRIQVDSISSRLLQDPIFTRSSVCELPPELKILFRLDQVDSPITYPPLLFKTNFPLDRFPPRSRFQSPPLASPNARPNPTSHLLLRGAPPIVRHEPPRFASKVAPHHFLSTSPHEGFSPLTLGNNFPRHFLLPRERPFFPASPLPQRMDVFTNFLFLFSASCPPSEPPKPLFQEIFDAFRGFFIFPGDDLLFLLSIDSSKRHWPSFFSSEYSMNVCSALSSVIDQHGVVLFSFFCGRERSPLEALPLFPHHLRPIYSPPQLLPSDHPREFSG